MEQKHVPSSAVEEGNAMLDRNRNLVLPVTLVPVLSGKLKIGAR